MDETLETFNIDITIYISYFLLYYFDICYITFENIDFKIHLLTTLQ